jgi:hypothetical protein
MTDPNSAIPRWARGVLRTVGIVNAALALIGTSIVVDSIYRFWTGKYRALPNAPYFQTAFIVMLAIETVFQATLLVPTVRLMRARPSAINSYSIWVLAAVAYQLAIGELWRPGPRWGSASLLPRESRPLLFPNYSYRCPQLFCCP